jgi:hypothetical protein
MGPVGVVTSRKVVVKLRAELFLVVGEGDSEDWTDERSVR